MRVRAAPLSGLSFEERHRGNVDEIALDPFPSHSTGRAPESPEDWLPERPSRTVDRGDAHDEPEPRFHRPAVEGHERADPALEPEGVREGARPKTFCPKAP
jgi:hypothetical protein